MKRQKVGKILMILVLVFAVLIGGGFTYLYFNGMSGMSDTTEAKDGQIKVAAERGYTLIDIHAFTADHPEWFAKDGVHPDNDGAAAIAQEIYSVLSATA